MVSGAQLEGFYSILNGLRSSARRLLKHLEATRADLPDDRVALVQVELLFLALEEELPAAQSVNSYTPEAVCETLFQDLDVFF